MRSAITCRQHQAGLSFEVLSSMVSELIDHHEQHCEAREVGFDWESPSARTRVVRYGTRTCLASVLKQEPDAVLAEYHLCYRGVKVFCWSEYRWPHLLADDRKVLNEHYIDLPQECIDELMHYHIAMKTSWIKRYRARQTALSQSSQVNEVGIVTEPDRL